MTLKTTSEWVELISQSELPAITSTAQMLDGFSNDDKSSLPNLSKAILHDQGLSSCVLKVANSAQRINVNKVSTVSRAAVVLGIRSVKNICLTVKLVDSLFAHKNLDENVHDALMQLMANSFYAGMLAKMMVPKYSEETQEEVYLAAMLYRIGETAFLSKGGESARKLVEKRKNEKDNELYDFYCEKLIGTNFHDLTLGLATKWHFSDLLLKSLDQPETRTDEVKTVYYADKLSSSIADPCDEESFNDLLDAISAIMGVTVKQLKVRIEDTRQKSQELLSSYGASKLTDNIKALPHSKDFVEAKFKLKKIKLEKEASHNKDKLMLETISKLTLLAQSSKDVNDYFHLALKDCVRIFDCQRGAFFMQMEDKFVVKSRFSVNSRQESESLNLTANITSVDNVIGQVIKNNSPLNLTKKAICEGPYLLGNELVPILGNASLAILPIKIGKKMLGVVCVQQKEERDIFSAEDFNRMSVLFTHLSLCLNISVHLKTA